MAPRLMFAAVTACLLVLALGLAGPASAKRSVPRGFYGTVFDGYAVAASPENQDRHFSLMALSGVESARVTFPWTALEPVRNRFDYSRTDRTVLAAARHRIGVLPVLLYTPYWARRYKRKSYSPPRHNADFQLLLRKLIERYGPNGQIWKLNPDVPKLPIRSWQIWNEPNNDIERYWDAPKGTKYGWPRGYAGLLRASHTTIKKYDRGAKTVLGGLTGIAWLELRRLYKAGGRGSFDTAALQVYPETVDREVESLKRFREELVRAKDKRVRLWVTEVAFPAAKGKTKAINKQRQQTRAGMAARLTELYSRLGRRRGAFGLERVYWYTWASRYGKNKSAFDFSGLISSRDGMEIDPEPSLTAYRRSAQRAQGCVKSKFGVCE